MKPLLTSYPIPNKPHRCLNLQSQVCPDPEEDPRWVEQGILSHAQAAPTCDRKNNQIVTDGWMGEGTGQQYWQEGQGGHFSWAQWTNLSLI